MLNRRLLLAATAGAAFAPLAAPHVARAQGMPKITIGMSGWTGFAPLTLAEQAGLFKANGIEVETRFVPQAQRNLALASGALNCVVTTVDTMILWASTMPLEDFDARSTLVLLAVAAALFDLGFVGYLRRDEK